MNKLFTSYIIYWLFSAPEVVARHRYGRPVDCWAVGVITYILWVSITNYKGYNGAQRTTQIEMLIKSNWAHCSLYQLHNQHCSVCIFIFCVFFSYVQLIRESSILRWNWGGEHRSTQSHHLLSHCCWRLWVWFPLLGWHFTCRYMTPPHDGTKEPVQLFLISKLWI